METSGGKAELLETEGTAILHITNSLKNDKDLRKEFEKSLKVSLSCVDCFVLMNTNFVGHPCRLLTHDFQVWCRHSMWLCLSLWPVSTDFKTLYELDGHCCF